MDLQTDLQYESLSCHCDWKCFFLKWVTPIGWWGKGPFEKKKKNYCEFSQPRSWPPPPLKVVKGKNLFFFHTLTETHFGEKNFFSPYKSIKLRKISRFFPNISKIFGLSGKGVPPPHTEKFFLCRFALFRTWKKKK